MVAPWDDILDLVDGGIISVDWNNANILDLGFGGQVKPVLHFYAKHRFMKYVGVDSLPEDERTLGFSYSRYGEASVREGPHLPLMSREEFESRFSAHFETDLQDFLVSDTKVYDLVVLSSILHLHQVKLKWKEVVENSLRRLSLAGVLYLTVFDQDTEHGSFQKEEQDELESMLQVLRVDRGVGSRSQLRIVGKSKVH